MPTSIKSRTDKQIVRLWSQISDPSSWEPLFAKHGELLTPFGPRYPQPGLIGNRYFKSKPRILLMGINPGLGKGFESKDKTLFDATLRLARKSNARHLNSVMDVYSNQMSSWMIFSKWNVPDRLDLQFDDIAYFNVLHINTDVGSDNAKLNPVYKYAIQRFTTRQVELLRPHAILLLGKHGEKMLKKYWSDRPQELKVMSIWHPSSRTASGNPQGFSNQLDEAKDFLNQIRI